MGNLRGCSEHVRHYNALLCYLLLIMQGGCATPCFITSLVVCSVQQVLKDLQQAIGNMSKDYNYLSLTIMHHCPGRHMMDPGANPVVVDKPFECDLDALNRERNITWSAHREVGHRPSMSGMYTVYFTRQVAEYAIMRSCEIFGTR